MRSMGSYFGFINTCLHASSSCFHLDLKSPFLILTLCMLPPFRSPKPAGELAEKIRRAQEKENEKKERAAARKAQQKELKEVEKQKKKAERETLPSNRKISALANKMLQPVVSALQKADVVLQKAMTTLEPENGHLNLLKHMMEETVEAKKACQKALAQTAKGDSKPLDKLPFETEKSFNGHLRALNTQLAAVKNAMPKRSQHQQQA